jgi:hypothetical protein
VRGDMPDGAAAFYLLSGRGRSPRNDARGARGAGARLLPAAARVLDAGAGAAPWSLAVATRDPACLVTAVDLPEVMPAMPRWVALYELGLLLRTASGRVHSLVAYLGWLHDAGFEPPEQHRLAGQAQAVLLAAGKPADG